MCGYGLKMLNNPKCPILQPIITEFNSCNKLMTNHYSPHHLYDPYSVIMYWHPYHSIGSLAL